MDVGPSSINKNKEIRNGKNTRDSAVTVKTDIVVEVDEEMSASSSSSKEKNRSVARHAEWKPPV